MAAAGEQSHADAQAQELASRFEAQRISRDIARISSSQREEPEQELALPWEVRRAFRTKALVLANVQTWLVFVVVILTDVLFDMDDLESATGIMVGSIVAAMVSLTILWLCRRRYPVNYLMLFLTTTLAAVFWIMADVGFFTDFINIPAQLLGIIGVTLLILLVLVQMPTSPEKDTFLLFFGVFGGWAVGSIANGVLSWSQNMPWAGPAMASFIVWLACFVILFGAGRGLMRCNPDDYMIVVVAMTGNLFAIVAAPVVLLLFTVGIQCEGWVDSQEKPRPPDGAEPAPQVIPGDVGAEGQTAPARGAPAALPVAAVPQVGAV